MNAGYGRPPRPPAPRATRSGGRWGLVAGLGFALLVVGGGTGFLGVTAYRNFSARGNAGFGWAGSQNGKVDFRLRDPRVSEDDRVRLRGVAPRRRRARHGRHDARLRRREEGEDDARRRRRKGAPDVRRDPHERRPLDHRHVVRASRRKAEPRRSILVKTEGTAEPLAVAKILKAVASAEQPGLDHHGQAGDRRHSNQTGQMFAALLGWPQGTSPPSSRSKASAQRHARGRRRPADRQLKCRDVTTDLRLNEPRYASLPNIMKAKKKPIADKTPPITASTSRRDSRS